MTVKEGDPHGLMSSFNRVGYEWAGGCYRLLTNILREEWGFKGSVICDFKTKSYMNSRQMLLAGGDIGLINAETGYLGTGSGGVSFTNARDVSYLRRATHNTLYALANSNVMRADIIGYKLATWKVLVYTMDGVVAGGLVIWGALVIFFTLRGKGKQAKAEANAEEGGSEPAPEEAPNEASNE